MWNRRPIDPVVPASYQGPAPLPPVYASAPPVVQYSDPSPSFWTGAATFAGGAAIGGMLGYVIGDDDDDGNDWDYNDEDWDDIADDVDDIADDMDELNEGFEDFQEDAGERADELAQQREERADQLQQVATNVPINSNRAATNVPTSARQRPRTARRTRLSCATSSRNTKPTRCRTSFASARACPRPAAIGRRGSRSRRWAAAARTRPGSRRRR